MILPFTPEALARAADALLRGELIAFPTETVYGLGARADEPTAVAKIYAAKGRPADNPTIVHAATAEQALALAQEVPEAARALAHAFWPGPLTLVLAVRDGAGAPAVLAGGDTIGLRVPAHPVALALLARAAVPVAAPSANRSTGISPTLAAHVECSLGPELMVLDGGATGFGIESTIVDATSSPARVLRRGSISLAQLSAITPTIDLGSEVHEAGVRRSPGTSSRHYAPATPTHLRSRAQIDQADVSRLALLILGDRTAPSAFASLQLPADPLAYAHGLYAALHTLDGRGASEIWIEAPPDEPAWAAIQDRLRRATSVR